MFTTTALFIVFALNRRFPAFFFSKSEELTHLSLVRVDWMKHVSDQRVLKLAVFPASDFANVISGARRTPFWYCKEV